MPAKKKGINLVPEGRRSRSSLGSFFEWLLGAGRYIIIFTELMVIIAFVFRFKLDHDLSKLYENIEIKKEAITAQQSFEKEFRSIQESLLTIQELDQDRHTPQLVLKKIEEVIPQTISLTSFSYNQTRVSLEARAYSSSGLATFAHQLVSSPYFTDVKIGRISRGQSFEIVFSLDMIWKGETGDQKSN